MGRTSMHTHTHAAYMWITHTYSHMFIHILISRVTSRDKAGKQKYTQSDRDKLACMESDRGFHSLTVSMLTSDCSHLKSLRVSKAEKWEHQREEASKREWVRGERERERKHSLSFFMRADWEPARSRETMTTRQPTLATNPLFSQSEPDMQLSKG